MITVQFVNGPKHGQRIVVREAPLWMCFPVLRPFSIKDIEDPPITSAFEHITYRKKTVRVTKDGVMKRWITYRFWDEKEKKLWQTS